MDPGAGGVTPTSKWRPIQPWWVGNDMMSEDGGSNLPHNRPLSQEVATDDFDTEADRVQQDGVPVADPRCMFGPLPNSSFIGELDNPIRRELEGREVEAVVAQRSLSNDAGRHLAVSFVDTARTPSERDGCGPSGDSWREECGRLQIQLASLTTEKERWESDRRRLLAEDVDRDRDIEGLKRAVEAQSQLVMENLVAAQRLAAMGATSAPGGGTAPDNVFLQYAWVPPSRAASTTASRWGESGDHDSRWKPSTLRFSTSSEAGTLTKRARDEYAQSGGIRGRNADPRPSHRSAMIANAATTPAQGPTAAVAAGEALPRRDFDPAPVLSQVVSRSPPAATESHVWPSRRHPPTPPAISNGTTTTAVTPTTTDSGEYKKEDRVQPWPVAVAARPASTELVLAPSASALAQKKAPQYVAGRSTYDSMAYHDQPQTGWRRVNSSGNATGGEMMEGKSETWEWNGRRVVFHVAPPRQPLGEKGSEGQASTAGAQEKEPKTNERVDAPTVAAAPAMTADTERLHPIVPASLLNDIEEVKSTVQALAARAVGTRVLEPKTDPEQVIATGAMISGLGEGAGTVPVLLQPIPPDTRYQRSELSSTPPKQEVNGCPGVDVDTQRARRLEGRSGSTHNEPLDSSSEARKERLSIDRSAREGSDSGGSPVFTAVVGAPGDNLGDAGDVRSESAFDWPQPREGGRGIDDSRSREWPPEHRAPGLRRRAEGKSGTAKDGNTPLSPLAGKEGEEREHRGRSPSPSGSCSDRSRGGGAPGRPREGVVDAADSVSENESSPAEDVAGVRGARQARPVGVSDDSDAGFVAEDAVTTKPGTARSTAAEDKPHGEGAKSTAPQEGENDRSTNGGNISASVVVAEASASLAPGQEQPNEGADDDGRQRAVSEKASLLTT